LVALSDATAVALLDIGGPPGAVDGQPGDHAALVVPAGAPLRRGTKHRRAAPASGLGEQRRFALVLLRPGTLGDGPRPAPADDAPTRPPRRGWGCPSRPR